MSDEEVKKLVAITVQQQAQMREQQDQILSLVNLIKTRLEQNSPTQQVVAQIAESSQLEPTVQEGAIVSQHVHEEPVPVLHEYVQQSLDLEEPLPVLQDEPSTASMEPMDDFMGDGDYYDEI